MNTQKAKVTMLALVTAGFIGGLGLAGKASADVIPYPNPGVPNPIVYNFIALNTGPVDGYFAGSDAAYESFLGLLVNGVDVLAPGLNNHSSTPGDFHHFANVIAGDSLIFYLHVNETNANWYSNGPNIDGDNHIYSTPFAGGTLPGLGGGVFVFPAGTYIGYEDLARVGDYDYNDTSFVLTNVTSAVPELSTWAMMLLGFAVLGLVAYRRQKKVAIC